MILGKKKKNLFEGAAGVLSLVSHMGKDVLTSNPTSTQETEAKDLISIHKKRAIEVVLDEAEALLEINSFAECEERLKRVLKKEKDHERANRIYIQLYLKRRKPVEALKHFTENEEQLETTNNLEVLCNQGHALLALTKYKTCKQIYLYVIEKSQDEALQYQAAENLAWIFIIQQKYVNALRLIEETARHALIFKQITAAMSHKTAAIEPPRKSHTTSKTDELSLLTVYSIAAFLHHVETVLSSSSSTTTESVQEPSSRERLEITLEIMNRNINVLEKNHETHKACSIRAAHCIYRLIKNVKEFVGASPSKEPLDTKTWCSYIEEHLGLIHEFWDKMEMTSRVGAVMGQCAALYADCNEGLFRLFIAAASSCHDAVLKHFPFDVPTLSDKIVITRLLLQFETAKKSNTHAISSQLCHLVLKRIRKYPNPLQNILCTTAIHKAAFTGKVEKLKKLLQEGKGTLTDPNEMGQTPLHLACFAGCKEIVAMATELSAKDILGYSPIQYAAIGGQLPVLKYLESRGVQIFEPNSVTPLHSAIEFEQAEVISYLVEYPNLKKPSFEVQDPSGRTALHWAVACNNKSLVRDLLKKGCNIHAADADGNTLLHIAVKDNRFKLIRFLLQNGASTKIANNEDLTSIELAEKLQRKELENIMKNFESVNLLKQLSGTVEPPQSSKITIRNIVFQGGGVKGIAYVGAMRRLSELLGGPEYPAVQRVGGTSAGAINALLVALGMTPEEMQDLLSNMDFVKFLDEPEFRNTFFELKEHTTLGSFIQHGETLYKIYKSIKQNYGLFLSKYLLEFVESIIKKKTGLTQPTFKELLDLKRSEPVRYKNLKELYVVGTNVTTGFAEIFSAEHTPNMIISDAIRISMAIPILFAPHHFYIKNLKGERVIDPSKANHMYIDGGILDNYPIWLFDRQKFIDEDLLAPGDSNVLGDEYVYNHETIGIRLVPPNRKNLFQNNEEQEVAPVKTLLSHFLNIINCFYEKQESDHYNSNDGKRTVYIDSMEIGTADFDLNEDKKSRLVKSGEDGVNDFLKRRSASEQFAIAGSEKLLSPQLIQVMAPFFTGYNTAYQAGKGITLRNINLIQQTPKLLLEICKTVKTKEEKEFIQNLDMFNWNATDTEGSNCLHLATLEAVDNVIDMLLNDFKVYKYAVKNNGESVLDLALQIPAVADRRRVVCKLVKAGVFITKQEQEVKQHLQVFKEFTNAQEDIRALQDFCSFYKIQ